MDKIFIEELILEGIHGVTAKEHERSQPFRIDISAYLNTKVAAHSDDIADSADYRAMKKAAEIVVQEEHHALIETMAHRIAQLVLEDQKIHTVVVTVKKISIWATGVPGVTVRRRRQK